MTKIARSHVRRPALGNAILDAARDVIVVDSRSGIEHEAAETPLDYVRFGRVLDLVALGIYRHHFRAPWLGEVRVHADFIANLDDAAAGRAARVAFFEAASQFFGSEPRHGDNPDVFWYQVVKPQGRHDCLMRLAFYGGCTATAILERSG